MRIGRVLSVGINVAPNLEPLYTILLVMFQMHEILRMFEQDVLYGSASRLRNVDE